MTTVTQVTADTYAVDAQMLGMPGSMSVYVVDADRPVVVDSGPATAAEHVLDGLEQCGIDPAEVASLFQTHVHLDHAGAAGSLAEACPNAEVVVHERGVDYLTDAEKLSRLYESARQALGDDIAAGYGEPARVPRDRCRVVSGGESLDLGDRRLEVIHAPGHAPHQVCALDSRTGTLFAADAAGMSLFDQLLPTTPAPDFDLDRSLETVALLRDREPETICYGHFGAREDAVDALDAYTELLPRWVEAVESAAETAGTRDVDAVVAELGGDWPSPTIERDVLGVLRTTE
ncbi:MBL fold metallo-hydrolase [Haloarchaeobius amylolyticus]|uniref:MBL fold metallo-hydrolase n=1 Tax=Haloarchaeobius amylolyticus TaxID=1198296 RepID=UPI00226DEB0E|nr:MBL fold metallo-hydrolase [Haloarchaeobius amylolyticus]